MKKGKVKKFLILAAAAASLLFSQAMFSCSGDSDSSSSPSHEAPDDSRPYPDAPETPETSAEKSTDVFTGSKAFNDTDWKVDIQIPADKFSDFAAGSKIVVETANISQATYHKIKFNAAKNSGWTELTAGTYSPERDSANGGVEPNGSAAYTVTESDAAELKANGFALNGYGVTVTKITLVTGGGADENPPQSDTEDPETPENPETVYTLSVSPVSLEFSDETAKTVTVTTNGTFTAASADESVATVSQSGNAVTVTPKISNEARTAKITIVCNEDSAKKAEISVKVNAKASENPSDPQTPETPETPEIPAEKSTDVFTGSKAFNDTDWKVDIQIPAAKFSDFAAGSKIIVETANISQATYHKIKFNAAKNSGWTELTAGTYSPARDSANGGVEPNGSAAYTVTESDASDLKANGFALNGYGVTVTKITLVTGGFAGENPPQSDTEEPEIPPPVQEGTPFKNHGALHVTGAYLYDAHDEKCQLYGMSTHGLTFGQEFSRYINQAAMDTLVKDWNTNCIRLVLYPTQYGGYTAGGDKTALKKLISDGIEYATKAGMYVIVDWHIHAESPAPTKNDAKEFLGYISQKYAAYANVLYEICNEPTGSPWASVIKPYAEEIIPVIRANAPDSVIIVGTNTWSQDIQEAQASPLDFKNVMYTFHFYADTHKDEFRSRVENCIKAGLPVFITEYGTCDASGNGGFNSSETQKWFDLISKYNISHMNWSLSAKDETASALSPGCSKTSDWTESDLTDSGKLVLKHFKTLKW